MIIIDVFKDLSLLLLNPIPTGHGRNQPIYECQVTTSGRNRVKYGFTLDNDNKKYDRFGFNHNRHCGFYVSKSNKSILLYPK